MRGLVVRALKAFALVAGLIWIMALPLAALRWDAPRAFFFATAGALITAGLGVPIVLGLDAVARRGLPGESAYPHQQRRTLSTRRSSHEAFQLVELVLKSQSWLRLTATGRREGTLAARVPASLASSGERVAVHVTRTESGATTVIMTSEPLLRLTLIDFGKNWKNLERLEQALRPRLA